MERQKPRVCAYARVSTDNEAQETSCSNQIEIYTQMILSNPDWEFAGVYADPAMTGTNADRPQFQAMLKDAEKHRIDIILVKSLSRFARNTLLAIQTIRHLQNLGVAVIFEKEHIDTSKPYSEMMLTILAAFAQEESRTISERCTKGRRMREANGQVQWSEIYGYERKDGTDYRIVESQAKVIRRIFNEYETGASTGDIARSLNADGISTKAGFDWSAEKVSKILKNEKYAGDILTNKTYTLNHLTHKAVKNHGEVPQIHLVDHHEAIVGREQYNQVQEILRMRSEKNYPYKDLLLCPHCGKKMEKINGALGTNGSVWGCTKDAFYIRTKKIDQCLLRAYSEMNPEDVSDEATRKIKQKYPAFSTPDYWWISNLVAGITFGEHDSRPESQTMTVHWYAGSQTTLPTGAGPAYKIKCRMLTLEERKKPARGKLQVTRIPAVKKA